jgi:hypothetical protein
VRAPHSKRRESDLADRIGADALTERPERRCVGDVGERELDGHRRHLQARHLDLVLGAELVL